MTDTATAPETTTRPRGPYGMEYIRLEVPDLAASREFYEYHVGLEAVEISDERVALRANLSHHVVELISAPERQAAYTSAIGYSVESREVLADLERRVKAAGLEIQELDKHVVGLVTDGFAVTDPNGLVIELVYEFQEWADEPQIPLHPMDIVHPFLSTDKYEATLEFYMNVLGFLPSDYIADMTAFLRAEDRYHHSLAIRRDKGFFVAHVCFKMRNLDHVFRGRAKARYKGVRIASDIVNHSASTSIAFYMQEAQHGPRIELCDGHRVLTEDEHEVTHRARRMALDPRNIDIWRAAADDWKDF